MFLAASTASTPSSPGTLSHSNTDKTHESFIHIKGFSPQPQKAVTNMQPGTSR